MRQPLLRQQARPGAARLRVPEGARPVRRPARLPRRRPSCPTATTSGGTSGSPTPATAGTTTPASTAARHSPTRATPAACPACRRTCSRTARAATNPELERGPRRRGEAQLPARLLHRSGQGHRPDGLRLVVGARPSPAAPRRGAVPPPRSRPRSASPSTAEAKALDAARRPASRPVAKRACVLVALVALALASPGAAAATTTPKPRRGDAAAEAGRRAQPGLDRPVRGLRGLERRHAARRSRRRSWRCATS